MADYKDMIVGTLGKLVDKAKEFAASDTVSGARQKLDEATEGSMIRSVYQQGSARAKLYARIARLSLDRNGQTEELKRVYTEIGKLYFDSARLSPEGIFEPLFAQAETLIGEIEAKSAEIDELKAEVEEHKSDAGIDVEISVEPDSAADADIADFEQIVDATGNEGKNEE